MREREPGEGEGPRVRWLGRAYQGALEAVLAVVVMAVLGALADRRFDTAPVLVLLGLAIGFGSFVLRLVRLLRELQEPPPGSRGSTGEG